MLLKVIIVFKAINQIQKKILIFSITNKKFKMITQIFQIFKQTLILKSIIWQIKKQIKICKQINICKQICKNRFIMKLYKKYKQKMCVGKLKLQIKKGKLFKK